MTKRGCDFSPYHFRLDRRPVVYAWHVIKAPIIFPQLLTLCGDGFRRADTGSERAPDTRRGRAASGYKNPWRSHLNQCQAVSTPDLIRIPAKPKSLVL
ncbi:hypothetical protein EM6_1886 [Asticcacaulis excentricus]|uniref:Uncharacterized protein n=1 Tax=Asticcacaulis excentricus TaxID=78587 RepID=A0A3G9GA18_9CAUL|nr:hypothetical protein EM6_1886 [Asticcacaulis excentricus]